MSLTQTNEPNTLERPRSHMNKMSRFKNTNLDDVTRKMIEHEERKNTETKHNICKLPKIPMGRTTACATATDRETRRTEQSKRG